MSESVDEDLRTRAVCDFFGKVFFSVTNPPEDLVSGMFVIVCLFVCLYGHNINIINVHTTLYQHKTYTLNKLLL